MMLFASQAAAAIANARIHRDEQRARADIEALIETSPVGVVVFDARTGVPVSFNQESRRIVEGLRMPDRSVEALLKVITAHREDGRSVSLARLPLAQRSSDAETVHAEEITLSTPDGRSLKTLVNATPIHSADGAVESVVVTLQDLAPLEELERLQAEFLGRVSHELRAPLTSIKGSTATVLGASQPLDPAEAVQFFRIIDEQADHMHGLINDLLDAGRIETGTLSVVPEPTAVASLVDQARNTFLSGGGRQSIRIDLPPDLPWVMADRRRVVQVLNNLLSNASRHSPASSLIRVDAAHDGGALPSRCPTKARGCRRSNCRTCSGSTRRPTAASGLLNGSASVCPSARGWWRRTGAASGPRAAARTRERVSPSRFRRPPKPALQPLSTRIAPAPRGKDANRRAFSWSTTTHRAYATSGTHWRRPVTHRSLRAIRESCPASSGRTTRGWSSWTSCCPGPMASS